MISREDGKNENNNKVHNETHSEVLDPMLVEDADNVVGVKLDAVDVVVDDVVLVVFVEVEVVLVFVLVLVSVSDVEVVVSEVEVVDVVDVVVSVVDVNGGVKIGVAGRVVWLAVALVRWVRELMDEPEGVGDGTSEVSETPVAPEVEFVDIQKDKRVK